MTTRAGASAGLTRELHNVFDPPVSTRSLPSGAHHTQTRAIEALRP